MTTNLLTRLIVLAAATFSLHAAELPEPWKHQDIGLAQVGGEKSAIVAGTAKHADGTFTLQGTMDMWTVADGSHFVWQPVHGDAVLVARVTGMENPGKVEHAKASICIRESLDGGSRCVTQSTTPGDGTQFTYREKTSEKAVRIFPDAAAPKPSVPKGQFPGWLKLVRRGNDFTGYESADGETWWLTGQITLELKADAVIGITSSSHTKDTLTTSLFDHVKLSKPDSGAGVKQKSNRVSRLATIGIDGSDKRVIYQVNESIEAPNWSPDGKWLVINSKGALLRIPADGSAKPEVIPTGDVTGANNDHVLSPDGKTIYFSAQSHLFAVPFDGGQPRRISNDQPPERRFKYFLHGVSPDEKTLAYAGVENESGNPWGRIDLWTIPVAGGPDTRLTNTPAPDDGPEYSADGQWIYFNSELNAKVPGHAQCYRMKLDGTGIEQLTHDERVNWFPHISPDGKWVVYISFPPGTVKHPADKDVILRRMRPDGSEQGDIIAFNGGQGTINVNSWSPDSKRFAFVMYDVVAK